MMRAKNKLPGLLIGAMDGGSLERRVVRLLETPWARRWRVASGVGCVAMMGVLSLGVVMLGVQPVLAQILHATGPLPSFEVATIKLSNQPLRSGGGSPSLWVSTGTVQSLISSAYNLPWRASERLIGGPGWINSDHYLIQAKIPDDMLAKIQTMPGKDRVTQFSLMEQSLLASRFKLKVHFEMRELPVYELVVAKGGPKQLTKSAVADPNAPPAPVALPAGVTVINYGDRYGRDGSLFVSRGAQGAQLMTTKGMPMDNVARAIETMADDAGGRTIVNKTGLDGQYDFTLNWTTQQGASAPGAESALPENEAPSIFTALEEQLGLKLVPAKGMVEVVVIDGIERPTEN